MNQGKIIYRPDYETKKLLFMIIEKYEIIAKKMEEMEHLLGKLDELTNELNDLRLSFESLDSELNEIKNKIMGSEEVAS